MIRNPTPTVWAIIVVLAIAAALAPMWLGPYGVKFATRIISLGILVLSLDLLIGVTGLVSFGHAAFYGLGAYAVWFVSPKDDSADLLKALALAIGLAGGAAAIIGAFAVRTRGFYFIMVTLAASQMLYALFHDTRIAGGSDGASIAVKPDLVIAGVTLIDFYNRNSIYWFGLAALALCYLLTLWLAQTPFGRALQGVRQNETRMSALGFETYWFKLTVFVIAGAMAGLGGLVFACIDGFVPPEALGWKQSGLAIMMVVLGGTGTLHGPIFGAIIYAMLEEALKSSGIAGATIADHWAIPLGLVLIAVELGAPKGVAGLLPRRAAQKLTPSTDEPRIVATTQRLSVENVGRRFGGLVAVDGVTLSFEPNKVHAVIGPNGAGKTTFTNLLSGALPVSAGRIALDDEDITALSAAAKARRGIGRSFQRTNVFGDFTVGENCAVAAQARRPGVLRFGADRLREAEAVGFALDATGLRERAQIRAGDLSHGEQRQLEIAMLIASGAKILILDEPLAGTGPEETRRVMDLLRALTLDHTIIIIEHDMDAVFSAADTISVLVGGRLIARGAPDDIRRDAAVREAYLGNFGMERAP